MEGCDRTLSITLDVRQEPDGKKILSRKFESLEVAITTARQHAADTQRTILLGEGRHILGQTLVLDHRDSRRIHLCGRVAFAR